MSVHHRCIQGVELRVIPSVLIVSRATKKPDLPVTASEVLGAQTWFFYFPVTVSDAFGVQTWFLLLQYIKDEFIYPPWKKEKRTYDEVETRR